jgi:hypothetical protein
MPVHAACGRLEAHVGPGCLASRGLNHPLISTRSNDFKGLRLKRAIEIPSNYGHLRK